MTRGGAAIRNATEAAGPPGLADLSQAKAYTPQNPHPTEHNMFLFINSFWNQPALSAMKWDTCVAK